MRLRSDSKPYVRFSVTKKTQMLTVFIFLICFFYLKTLTIFAFHDTHESDLQHVRTAKGPNERGVSTVCHWSSIGY